jgi:hypothetical protein
MKKLLVATLFILAAAVLLPAQHHGHAEDSVNIAGKWQMSMDSPHGPLTGDFDIKQDGSKINATFDSDHVGKLAFAGTLEGKKLTLNIDPPGQMSVTLAGTVDGNKITGKMEPNGGAWSATRK